jgi:hypothetical protein
VGKVHYPCADVGPFTRLTLFRALEILAAAVTLDARDFKTNYRILHIYLYIVKGEV